MLKKILLGLSAVVVLFLVVAAFQSEDLRISRSVVVNAPADKIFPMVNDLRAFDKWNPFMACDPQAKVTYDGPPSGVGCSSTWSGNNQIGAGKNTIVESRPGQQITMRLDFERPMKATNQAQFTFQPQGQGTLVTWALSGKKNYVSKVMGMIMNMDKMVGGQFEIGLANLKATAEK